MQQIDKWKEEFLLSIEENYKAYTGIKNSTTYSNNEYKIIGLEFYNYSDENKFKNSLNKKIKKLCKTQITNKN